MESLDRTDQEILALLQADGRLTGAEVGRRVGLSQPAASARIQRLEKNGVIIGYRAWSTRQPSG
ncbi:winged helix-turn-helix transcriptional regulator [Streptomyces sp. NPDC051172]|uniref:Lrp/AsnC family transcriptional regulator n=1 Tax=Streptomyces sp. NPDC051172 TaxID=3155796 RepID=UPI00343F0CA1